MSCSDRHTSFLQHLAQNVTEASAPSAAAPRVCPPSRQTGPRALPWGIGGVAEGTTAIVQAELAAAWRAGRDAAAALVARDARTANRDNGNWPITRMPERLVALSWRSHRSTLRCAHDHPTF
jgi:hypothetical protein